MDGYAMRAADTPGTLRLTGEQPAGAARNLRVEPGTIVRIFTGAPMPSGADAVVMQEDVTATGAEVRIAEAVEAGEFVRRRGGDVCEGQLLVAAGEPLTAPRIGLLCAAGVESVAVCRRPRVAVITTGDELRPPGAALQPGELYNSNGPMLAAQLGDCAVVAGIAHSPDDPSTLADVIRSFPDADALVLSGGVSVGDHDPVHDALRELGAEVGLWRVAVKPGKPFLFARLGGQFVFGLPGNPVSSFVTAHLFVRPALARMSGAAHPLPAFLQAPLGATVENSDTRRVLYMRAALRDGTAFPSPLQQSHGLASLAAADVLLRIPPGARCDAGQPVTTLLLNFGLTQLFNIY